MVTETEAQRRTKAIVAFMQQHQGAPLDWVLTQLITQGYSRSEIGVAFLTYIHTT